MAPTSLSTEVVWSRLSNELRRFIRRRVEDDHIHRRLGNLEKSESLVAWVYRIARNLVTDHHRANKPSGDCQLDSVPTNEETCGSFERQAAAWMAEMIDSLPEKYRLAVRLSEVEGLAQQEVANRLGLSLSGAKSRIQRGRVLLKGILDQCCTFHRDRRGNVIDCERKPERKTCRNCDV